jgi:creatinine amidohydrolase/Fe(II)-dependent formamide hydrolase-like protein
MRTDYRTEMMLEDACEASAQTDTAFVPMAAVEAHGRPAGVEITLLMRERWPLGNWDTSKPAAEASAEAGEKILETVTDNLGRFATAFQTLPLDLGRGDEA